MAALSNETSTAEVQNTDLKRRLTSSSSDQLPKKRKLQSGLDPQNIRMENLGEKPWPAIFSNDGPPLVIQASVPSTPSHLSQLSASVTDLRTPLHPSNQSPSQLYLSHMIAEAYSERDQMSEDLKRAEEEMTSLKVTVASLQTQIQYLTQTVLSAETYRKTLHSHILDLKGPIKVMCRVKPGNEMMSVGYPEQDLGQKNSILHSVSVSAGFSRLNFTCDCVFPHTSTQEDVFAEVKSYIQAALDGDHVTIFAYGQTGSGKTYTLEGPHLTTVLDSSSGLVPRAAVYIFDGVQQQRVSATLRVLVACLYISNDTLQDLVSCQNHKLNIKTLGGKVVVDLLSWHEVTSAAQLLQVIHMARTRKTAESRSHCIYQIVLEGSDASGKIIEGQLNLVELAGAEAQTSTLAEAKFINLSFSCLRRVISLKIKNVHKDSGLIPPYRESKLTRVLQDSLSSATAKILLLVTVSGDRAGETKETLKFAQETQTCVG